MANDMSINRPSVIYTLDPAMRINVRTDNASTTNGDIASTDSTSTQDRGDYSLSQSEVKRVQIADEELLKVIDKANKAIQGPGTTLEFSIHEKTKAIMVKVMNKDTGEVIREMPPEKILDMVAKMCELAGIFVDERR